jgi:hypothetical protein
MHFCSDRQSRANGHGHHMSGGSVLYWLSVFELISEGSYGLYKNGMRQETAKF